VITRIKDELRHADSRHLVLKGVALYRAISKIGSRNCLAIIPASYGFRGCSCASYNRVAVQPRIIPCIKYQSTRKLWRNFTGKYPPDRWGGSYSPPVRRPPRHRLVARGGTCRPGDPALCPYRTLHVASRVLTQKRVQRLHIYGYSVLKSLSAIMNWARDNAYLSKQEADLKRIFKYETRTSLAVKIVKSNGVRQKCSYEMKTK
jgi:hypothetical protein